MKNKIKDAKVYLVLDTQVADPVHLKEMLNKAVDAGVDIVQLRDKSGSERDQVALARDCVRIISGRIPFIMNDRPDLAVEAGADGVHLGQEDGTVEDARHMVGPHRIVGVSCQELGHITEAHQSSADYIGFGSVFKTETKPDRKPMDPVLLEKACQLAEIPLFAIGGIGQENASALRKLGVTRIAVTRAICDADDVQQAVQQLRTNMGEA